MTPGQYHLSNEQCADTGMCSEVEKVICTANAKIHECQAQKQDNENHLVPGTEKSIEKKIDRKINAYCSRNHSLRNKPQHECHQRAQ